MELTSEQQAVIDGIEHNDLIVNSVAGSGKTTVSLYIAEKYRKWKILLLTYNKKLQLESETRRQSLGFKNITIKTIHSYIGKICKGDCKDDSSLRNTLDESKPKKIDFDCIIVDECQDMTPLLFRAVKIIIGANEKYPRLMFIGDERQNIYSYVGSDSRYLSMADKLFKGNWKRLTITQSFRITMNMAEFINKHVYGKTVIKSMKNSPLKVMYIQEDMFRSNILALRIMHLINNQYCSPSDIMILASSVRQNSNRANPINKLSNYLSNNGIPIYIPSNDEENINDMVIENKILISSYHQAKGLERDVIILYGFDQYEEKDEKFHECPNKLYVGLTRAKKLLMIVQNSSNSSHRFLKYPFTDCVESNITKMKIDNKDSDTIILKKWDQLLRSAPYWLIDELYSIIKINLVQEADNVIPAEEFSKQGKLTEAVSDLNGTFIPAKFAFMKNNKLPFNNETTLSKLISDFHRDNLGKKKRKHIKKRFNSLGIVVKDGVVNISDDILMMDCISWNSHKSGNYVKKNQIKEINWLSDGMILPAIKRLEDTIGDDAEFEYKVEDDITTGFVDCITKDTVWEFKFCKDLKKEHFIQLCIYMSMIPDKYSNYSFKLFNIRTNEIWEIERDIDLAKHIYHRLSEYKMPKMTDEQFLTKNS